MKESHSFCSAFTLKHQFLVNVILLIHSNYRKIEKGKDDKGPEPEPVKAAIQYPNMVDW